MNKLVVYLESKEVVFHGALILIILYVPHAGHLFMQSEHLEMTVFDFSILNWLYGIALAAVVEFVILVLQAIGSDISGSKDPNRNMAQRPKDDQTLWQREGRFL